jgi:molecular chaperone DnaK (HSP70)
LKAYETLTATRKALKDFGAEIESDYRSQIELALQAVESTLATESETGAGDLKKLQASVAALDETTKPLADFLMDKAMEAMLRKRGLLH